jgi:hypothetical protein
VEVSTMSAEDRLAVHDVMHRYALAIDTKNWTLLATVFADRVTADFRSFGSKEVFEGAAAGWIEAVRSTIQGMDATQHMMGNHLYTIDGDCARGTTDIRALHVCKNDWGGDSYTVGGHYTVEMVRSPEGWRIEKYTLHVTWHDGDRHVLRVATRKASHIL